MMHSVRATHFTGETAHGRLLLAVVALGAALRLFHLGFQSLWVDEMLTLSVATPKPGYPIWQLLRHNIHGPLHAFVVFLFRELSTSDAWLRLPSALAGTLAIPLVFAWVRPRFGARVALWSALLLAVNPLHVHYSQELRNYAFAVCLVLAGCVALDRVLARWSAGRAGALALCIAGAVLSNFSATFSYLAQSLAYAARAGLSARSVLRWAVVAVVVCVLVSPWIYRVTTFVDFGRLVDPVLPGELAVEERLRGETTFRPEAIPYAAYAYSVGFTLGPSLRELHDDASLRGVLSRHAAPVLWTAFLFTSLLVAGIHGAIRAGHGRVVGEVLLYIVVPLSATLLLNWQNAKAFNVRYVLVGLPMYLTLIALGIASRRGRASHLAGALVVATCLGSLAHHYFEPRYAKEDVRGALRWVEPQLAAGECIFAPTVWQIVQHYAATDAPVHYVYGDAPSAMPRQLDALASQCDSFWYLRARPWVDDPDGRVLAALDARYQRAQSREFAGVSAIRFVRR